MNWVKSCFLFVGQTTLGHQDHHRHRSGARHDRIIIEHHRIGTEPKRGFQREYLSEQAPSLPKEHQLSPSAKSGVLTSTPRAARGIVGPGLRARICLAEKPLAVSAVCRPTRSVTTTSMTNDRSSTNVTSPKPPRYSAPPVTKPPRQDCSKAALRAELKSRQSLTRAL